VSSCESSVRICGTHHAKLVGIDAELFFDLQPISQCSTGVLELEHVIRLKHAEIEIALVPLFVTSELVIGRKKRMSFAVTLDLSHLINSFPERSRLRVFAIDWLAGKGFN